MLRTKFRRNQPTGSRKKIFLRVYTIYVHGGHLGNVASFMLINFHSMFLKAYIFCLKLAKRPCLRKTVSIFICKLPWAKVRK